MSNFSKTFYYSVSTCVAANGSDNEIHVASTHRFQVLFIIYSRVFFSFVRWLLSCVNHPNNSNASEFSHFLKHCIERVKMIVGELESMKVGHHSRTASSRGKKEKKAWHWEIEREKKLNSSTLNFDKNVNESEANNSSSTPILYQTVHCCSCDSFRHVWLQNLSIP